MFAGRIRARSRYFCPQTARKGLSFPGVRGFRWPTSSGSGFGDSVGRGRQIDLLLHSDVTLRLVGALGQGKMNKCPRCNGLITLEPPDEKIGERRPYYHCNTCGWEKSVEPPAPKPIPGKKPPPSRPEGGQLVGKLVYFPLQRLVASLHLVVGLNVKWRSQEVLGAHDSQVVPEGS